jgi:hypothetical protein
MASASPTPGSTSKMTFRAMGLVPRLINPPAKLAAF